MIGTVPFEIPADELNPLDLIEEFFEEKDWVFTRESTTVLVADAKSKNMTYSLALEWQDEFSSLMLCCAVKLPVSQEQRSHAIELLQQMNDNLWLGHFDLTTEGVYPTFRYTFLFRNIPSQVSVDIAADVIEMAVAECDRFYQTFQCLSQGDIRTQDSLSAAILETVGEA